MGNEACSMSPIWTPAARVVQKQGFLVKYSRNKEEKPQKWWLLEQKSSVDPSDFVSWPLQGVSTPMLIEIGPPHRGCSVNIMLCTIPATPAQMWGCSVSEERSRTLALLGEMGEWAREGERGQDGWGERRGETEPSGQRVNGEREGGTERKLLDLLQRRASVRGGQTQRGRGREKKKL